MLGPSHLWSAIVYVERNPVRAGMVKRSRDYRWSSAAAHMSGTDKDGILDMEWWRREAPDDWSGRVDLAADESETELRQCAYSGRPFGGEEFVEAIAQRFGRYWKRGRPPKEKKKAASVTHEETAKQFSFFEG